FTTDYVRWFGHFSVEASAFVVLLPYLEQQGLYQTLNQIAPFQAYPTDPAFGTPLSTFVCPSDSGVPTPAVIQDPFTTGNPNRALTSYRPNVSALNVGNAKFGQDGVIVDANFGRAAPVQVTAIMDGTSNTFLFGEYCNFDPNMSLYTSYYGLPSSVLQRYSEWSE